jgi:hypothetical protein
VRRPTTALIAVVASLAAPAAAGAQDAPTRYGGGNIVQGGLLLVSASLGGGQLQYRMWVQAACPGHDDQPLVMEGTAPVAPDGSFSAEGQGQSQGTVGERITAPYKVSGVANSAFVEGMMTTSVRRTRNGRTTTCRLRVSGKRFHAPLAIEAVEPYSTMLTMPLFGLTRDVPGHRPVPIVIRKGRIGTHVFAAWVATPSCDRPGVEVFDFANVTPLMRLGRHGGFARHERFTLRFHDGKVGVRADTTGTMQVASARGTIRLRETQYAKDGRRVIARCDTGVLHWSARPRHS